MLEYAVLIAAVILGVTAAARFVHNRFTEHAQRIERENVVF